MAKLIPNLNTIEAVEFAVLERMTAGKFLQLYIDNGYFPDQVIKILGSLIPEAYALPDKGQALKLLCNTIKRI